MKINKVGLFIAGDRGYKLIEPLQQNGINFKVIHIENQRYIISSLFQIAKLLKGYQIDFILCDMPYLVGIQAVILSKLLNVPVILRVRGDVFQEDRDRIFRRILTWVQGKLIKKTSNVWIIPVSKALCKKIICQWGLCDCKVKVINIPNYVKANKLIQRHNGKYLRIISVMNMNFSEKVKGLIDFYLSASDFIKQNDIQVTIVGDGPLREHASHKLSKLGNKVKFVGRSQNVGKLYSQHNVFVHASYLDAFPSVVLEAMSYGLPVIAGGYQSVEEQVSDNESGFIVNPRDKNKICNILERLYHNPWIREKLGYAAHERINNIFSLKVVSKAWGEVFKLIEERRCI